jgi:hypothetical protein
MRRAAPLLLLLLCAGCPGEGPRATEPDAAGLAALDSSLACYAALERQGEEQRLLTWGEDLVFRVSRRVDGWERLDGAAHARVVTSHVDLRSFMVEWLRPAGDRVLCAARLFAAEDGLHRLVPPQPVLVAPLEAGRAWSWSGLADGAPAEADFRITFVGERDGLPGERLRVVEVEQTTRASGVTSTRVQTWVAERGLVDERGTMPTNDAPGGKVHHTKTPRPEEWR